jgi:hypothetical protein
MQGETSIPRQGWQPSKLGQYQCALKNCTPALRRLAAALLEALGLLLQLLLRLLTLGRRQAARWRAQADGSGSGRLLLRH